MNRFSVTTKAQKKQGYLLPGVMILGGILASFLWIKLFSHQAIRGTSLSYQTLPAYQPVTLPEIVNEPQSEAARHFIQQHWKTITIQPGDNLAKIFSSLGINHDTVKQITAVSQAKKALKSLKPRQKMRLLITAGHQLEQLIYPLSITRSLAVSRNGNTFISRIIEQPLEKRMRYVSTAIRDSLFTDANKAGLTHAMILELSKIFAWDIDFAKDLRPGDQFSVIYEEEFRNNEKIGAGKIVAAEFTNQSHTFQAIRYTAPNGETGFYSPTGNSLRKTFLRTPVRFSHISSFYSKARFHPILHYFRAHTGVDYAASMGTPVKAAGNGRVVFRGRQGGYGNMIVLQHNGPYSTVYGHLSRFAHGLNHGARVRQGEIIGYVGMTGLASGPHLHYEFRVNGQHRNPLGVKMSYAEPIPERYRADFKRQSGRLLSKLTQLRLNTGLTAGINTGSEKV